MTGEAPRQIGRYRLLHTVARGGMGALYLAELANGDGWTKRVALKTVLPHLEDDPEFVDRFLDEARIAGGLQHANIVSVFDAGRADQGWFLAMEYVDGPDLRRVIKALRARNERMPESLALFVAAEVCAALAYAHRATGDDGGALRIVHRDVTPANVLVSRAGEVKLTDFGIAAARDRLGRTRTGQLRGTFAYMSPEQAAGQPVDPRSDLFAVGALLFELLSGQRAFDGDAELEVLAKVQRGERSDFAALEPDRAPTVVGLVERALAVEPGDRFESAEEMRRELLTVLEAAHGLVTRDDLSAWLSTAFPDGAGLGASTAGPNLDDILNAQLDGGPRDATPTSPPTGSRSATRSSPASSAPPADTGTVTRYEPPPSREVSVAPPRGGARQGLWIALALAVLGGIVAAVLLRPNDGRLSVQSEPPGAEVFVDGRPIGVTGLQTDIAPGVYELRIALDGHAPWTAPIEVGPRSLVEISETLAPADRDVQFHSVPAGALVQLDDGTPFPAGNTARVPVGRPVTLRMTLEGFLPLEETVRFGTDASILTRALTPDPTATVAEPDGPDAGAVPEDERPAPDARPSRSEPTATSWRLSGVPDGAQVTLDGAAVSGSTIRLARDARPATLRVEAPGMQPWERRLDPGRDDGGRVTIELQPAGDPGTLLVRFSAEPMVGDVWIDGRPQGRTTDLQQSFTLTPGRYAVEIRNDARGLRDRATLDVAAGESVTFSVDWQDG